MATNLGESGSFEKRNVLEFRKPSKRTEKVADNIRCIAENNPSNLRGD